EHAATAVQQLVAHQLQVLAVGPLVLVGGREQALQARVARLGLQQRHELGAQLLQELALDVREHHRDPAARSRLDQPFFLPQSCLIVAQSPCACRRATSYSAFSRVPFETTALPSLCTCSISSVAFARL